MRLRLSKVISGLFIAASLTVPLMVAPWPVLDQCQRPLKQWGQR
ncbi:hypothetical protein [Selenomonas sp.]|nr:hypothetical protein [Selenomonas sp.]